MKWKRLFICKMFWVVSKFYNYKSRLYGKVANRAKKNKFRDNLFKVLKNVLRKNSYTMLSVSFLIWMLFFDSADLITQFKLTRRSRKLHEERKYYHRQIEIVTQERNELMSDEAMLEKFAREKYLMKKPTEDVYIIEK